MYLECLYTRQQVLYELARNNCILTHRNLFSGLGSFLLSNFLIQWGEASMAHNIGILAGQHSGERTVDPALSTGFALIWRSQALQSNI